MGVPVAARNIFRRTSDADLYEVRIVEAGWRGRRGGVDLMVAMNPETWKVDMAEIEPGGYLVYDATRPLPADRTRADVTAIGVPLTALCHDAFSDPRQRQLFKNIAYLGSITFLLSIDPEVVESMLVEQYKAKAPLLDANRKAFRLGYDWTRDHVAPLGLKVEKRDRVGDRIFVDGNAAAALGAVYGGATVCAWYPITPSSSLAEAFQKYCRKLRVDKATGKHRFAIVQAEDELASIGMVVGAGWNGARSRRPQAPASR
jgi:2-oxoglutarate ferredoxin oxidoreductase subunit alpha